MATILIVDDEFAIVEMLTAVLEEEGYQVISAQNGLEGLTRLKKVQPAMVLCDQMMPILTGLEMCQKMHADQRYASIPFVLMSAVQPPEARDDCMLAAFLKKPFNLDTVLQLVGQVIRPDAC